MCCQINGDLVTHFIFTNDLYVLRTKVVSVPAHFKSRNDGSQWLCPYLHAHAGVDARVTKDEIDFLFFSSVKKLMKVSWHHLKLERRIESLSSSSREVFGKSKVELQSCRLVSFSCIDTNTVSGLVDQRISLEETGRAADKI